MAYHNAAYLLVFLPSVILFYQIAPHRARWMVLLGASCMFFWSVSGKLLIYLIGSTLFTHYICVCMMWVRAEGEQAGKRSEQELRARKTEKRILIFGIIVLTGVLAYLKYYNFFVGNWNAVSDKVHAFPHLPQKSLLLPLGISFYTLQAIGYMVDVYWKKAEVCIHPGKTALFLGFFPIIMEGPVCSYTQISDDLWKGRPVRSEQLTEGLTRILWGLFKKLIIADRLDVMVNMIFGHHEKYHGLMILAAAIAYTIQLYMEFSGCIDIVIGSGRIFGVRLPENFRQPFFALDASDFWRRWHISLGVWLRTYIFYPVSTSAFVKKLSCSSKGKNGRYFSKLRVLAVALFPVWLCNGLWHGARWSYIFFGMYYYVILLAEAAAEPLTRWILKTIHVNKDAFFFRILCILKTWVIVFTGELFFRADSLKTGMQMFLSMFQGASPGQFAGGALLKLGLDQADITAVVVGTAIVFIVDLAKEKQVFGNQGLKNLCLPLRWALYYCLLFSVIIFGAYGVGYQAVDMIYAGF